MAKTIWQERKVMVASATGIGLLIGYGMGGKWPHLLTAYPTLATGLVTLAAGFFAGNVVAKKFEPKPPAPP
jgi:hypothetical protein